MVNWKRLLSTPVPATGLVFTRSAVGGLRLGRKGLLACSVEALGPEAVEVGPVGLQAVDKISLTRAIRPVLESLRGAKRPLVVLPTGWLRIHILEFDELPRRSNEWDDLVRWRLKKLLPVRPSDLRVNTLALAPRDGRRALLSVSCLERALGDLETVLAELEVQPAVITPRLFGLAQAPNAGGLALIVQHEPGFLSMLLLEEGRPLFLRTKPLPGGADSRLVIPRELSISLTYMRDALGASGAIEVGVWAEDEAVAHELREWWSSQDEVSLMDPVRLPAGEELEGPPPEGVGLLEPAYAVMAGRFR